MQSESAPGELLYNLLYALFKRKGLVVLVFGITFIGIIFGTYLVRTSWVATAKLRVQYSTKQQLSLFEGITTPGGQVSGVNPANDLIQLLTSRELAEKLAREFKRDKLWEQRTNAPASVKEIIRGQIYDFLIGRPLRVLQYIGVLHNKPDNYLAEAVDEILDNLEDIELEEDTTIVNVGVWGESPDIATALANGLVALAMEKNRELSRAPLYAMRKSLKTQLIVADTELKKAQEKLRQFKNRAGLLSYEQEATILRNKLDKYDGELKDLRGQYASLRMEKLPTHPELLALGAKIKEYEEVIIPGIKERLQALPLSEIEYDKLERDTKVHQDLYMTLKEKILQIEVLINSSMGDLEIKVLDNAKVYSYVKPDWPKLFITLPLALMAALFSALAFVLFVEYWSSALKSLKDLASAVPLPALGAVPALPFYGRKNAFGFMMDSGFSAGGNKYLVRLARDAAARSLSAYDRLADSIQLKERDGAGKIHLISSPGPGEGKSTTAVFLARAFAKRGRKVLIIEADMRRPALEAILDVKSSRGLAEYCGGELKAEDVVVKTGGLSVIFAGDISSASAIPIEVLASDKMTKLLEYARDKYDYVFIDTPCIKNFTDALLIASSADGVILTAEADRTTRRSILMAVENINKADGRVSGIVLTKQTGYVPELFQWFLD